MIGRLLRLVGGLVLCGWGIAVMVAADIGLGPWDVLHEGVSLRTGVPIGTVSIGVGALVLLLWLPLRERPGFGTICNVVLIGVVIDLTLLVLETPSAMPWRVVLCLAGPVLFGIGSGFYLGARFGSGPRDGLMTGLARRGLPVAVARTGLELTVLLLGWALGGTVGFGTVWFAVAIGPLVHASLAWLSTPEPEPELEPGVRSAR